MQSVLWPAWAASQPFELGLSAAMPCRGGSDTLRGEGTDGRRSGTRAGPMASAGDECGITDGRASPRSPGSRLLRVIPRHLPRPREDGGAAGCGCGGRGAGSAPRGRRRTRVRVRERPDARRRERARSDVTRRSPNERRPCGEGAVPALARRRRSPALGPPPGGASVEARGRGGLGRRTVAAPDCGRRSGRAPGAAPSRPMSARWRRRGRRREEGGAESAGAGRRAAEAAGWGCCS